MKQLVLSFFLLFCLLACSGTSGTKNAGAPPPVTAANLQGYPLTLPAGGFVILVTTNHTAPLAVTGSDWWHDAVVYQIFAKAFAGGKLPTDRLDYLAKTGFTAIWTTPLFASPSHHGYDTTDYRTVDPSFGGMPAWDEYRTKADKLGIRLVLDLVLNHTGSGHPWFRDAERGKNNKRNWYIWSKEQPAGWMRPWGGGRPSSVWHWSHAAESHFYGAFWSGMPDLNYKNPEVTREAVAIGRHWLARGAAGFRFDAARYLIEDGPYPAQADTPTTRTWWKDYHRTLGKEFYSVGEVWVNDLTKVASYHEGGGSLRQVFDFSFYSALIRTLQTGNPDWLRNHILALKQSGAPLSFFAPFLDNHDQPHGNRRLMDALSGAGERNWALAKAAACLLLTFSGTPYVYYGTEVGMTKGPQHGDQAKRTPMDWAEAARQQDNEDSLLATYRRLIALRRREAALRRGDIIPLATKDNRFVAWLRPGPERSVIVVLNPGRERQRDLVNLSTLRGLAAHGRSLLEAAPVGSWRERGNAIFK